MSEKISYTTADGVVITGIYFAGAVGGKTAILLHMRPATKESWQVFAAQLVSSGFSALAIDLRGHGESVQAAGKTLDYHTMTEAEERQSIKDVEGAALWLEREHGVAPEELVLIGASIGANVALQFLADSPSVPAAVLLSPGLDYRGILTEPLAEKLSDEQRVMLIAAEDDAEASECVPVLAEKISGPHELKLFKSGGHGTKLFESHPDLQQEIIEWIK
ncbi:MAG: alpha/beta fold hydrolase [bacterium]|nr:alpha/beta fold hydrolase [bacterium]